MSFQLSAEENRPLAKRLMDLQYSGIELSEIVEFLEKALEVKRKGIDPVKYLERVYKEKTEGAEVNETGQSYVSE